MAKVLTPQKATSNADQGKKQRKKQAKREAKTMLKLEQAKQNVQKAEKKLAKTQAQLEAERTNLRDIEAELTKLRQPQPQEAPAIAATGDPAQVSEGDNIHEFMPSHEVISLPPVEGRMDIPESSEAATPAQETAGDASPSAVETDETQQESTESPRAEEHGEETSGSQSTHNTSRSRRRSQPGHEEATTHTDEAGTTEAGS